MTSTPNDYFLGEEFQTNPASVVARMRSDDPGHMVGGDANDAFTAEVLSFSQKTAGHGDRR